MAQQPLSTQDLAQPTAPAPRDADDRRMDFDEERIDLDAGRADVEGPAESLLDDAVAARFLERWADVQTRFVDDPQAAVRDGDALVAELMQTLAQRFSQHKSGLEEQWQSGREPGTEELRLALQQYRSFFQRLLST